MTVLNYRDAGKRALAEEMLRDSRVWALGEDLGRGGVFGQYSGLQETFGPDRIFDAPISEAAIMGSAVGAAMNGTRPVVEMRFSDFALCAIDELVNQAAKARYMFGGQTRVPLVAREPVGMWRSSAAQHSQSLESWYTHIPGLIVLMPSTPADNLGMLKSAIRCDDPVVYMEHKNLWDLQDDVADAEHLVEIGSGRTVCDGSDLTIVSWSAQVHTCARAVKTLKDDHDISAELIDLRSLWPWDQPMVFESVRKTGRLMVVQEAVVVSGFASEVAATVTEHCFESLNAPVRRLGAPRIPVAYSPPLEEAVTVNEQDIIDGALAQVLKRGSGG